ncbi:hypothetical protein [Streptomyces sp. 3214.6]|uniref:hypothetical protein n=1 Tax=Streptomyces sp. 3214.6 TaxID=1882757 RepID=UPI00090B59F9|nr:hypothetical protein [Streptomyces sp. 3214.6]SHI65768.1 hypothetical protein SAMN05444521_8157 [Streptomyces sp. 3214.6]
MTAPLFVRRLRTYFADVQIRHLRAQLAQAHDINRSLEQRLADLQAANEGAYRELRLATGGPTLDVEQPFGLFPVKDGTT